MKTTTILQQRLTNLLGKQCTLQLQPVSGGSINQTYRLHFGKDSFFCKVNSATKFPHLFQKEKAGLTLIEQQHQIKTPCVMDQFEAEGLQFLLLEWIDPGNRNETFWRTFGENLAALHQVRSDNFGLDEYNYMGSVLQQNNRQNSWCRFFAEERLLPMMQRCTAINLLSSNDCSLLEGLLQKLSSFFEEEKPSLLHGDLWSGNFLCSEKSEPVLIDPAVYYGHRSMDLAMTTLFGGFREPFYEAYHHHYPLPSNYKEQWAICNLYPLLIHLYLFGTSYLSPIRDTIRKFA
ncbi:MAG TPA: fructosamine kinase family protein [Flavisolibacter sp.]|jgi:fructosamine-3-kinase|nr:fructosamine kinase family protein [Flavisolibacter sp.]